MIDHGLDRPTTSTTGIGITFASAAVFKLYSDDYQLSVGVVSVIVKGQHFGQRHRVEGGLNPLNRIVFHHCLLWANDYSG